MELWGSMTLADAFGSLQVAWSKWQRPQWEGTALLIQVSFSPASLSLTDGKGFAAVRHREGNEFLGESTVSSDSPLRRAIIGLV